MKKVVLLLSLILFMTGCGSSGVSQEEYDAVVAERDELKAQIEELQGVETHLTEEMEISKTEDLVYFEINEEKLKSDGYSSISDVLYAKIENGENGAIIGVVCKQNMPDVCMYAIGRFGEGLDYEYDSYEIEWDGVVYEIKNDDSELEDYPPAWQALMNDMTEKKYGLNDIISVSVAKAMEDGVDRIVKDFLEDGETKIISRKQYEVDGGALDMTLSENNDGITLDIIGTADTEEKAFLMFSSFVVDFENLSEDFYACVGTVRYLDYHALYQQYSTNKVISAVNRDGSFTMEIPDWLDKDINNLEMSESEVEEYLLNIEQKLMDFGNLSGYKMGYLLEQ